MFSTSARTNEANYNDYHLIIIFVTGIYKVCFSNEFSTFSHKLVYMEFNVGPETPLPGIGDHATVLTQVI